MSWVVRPSEPREPQLHARPVDLSRGPWRSWCRWVDCPMDKLHEAAQARLRTVPSTRPYSADRDILGVMGEWAYQEATGIPMHLEEMPQGDGGWDFYDEGEDLYIDVKTTASSAKNPHLLLGVDETAIRDVYVLAVADVPQGRASLVGWMWGNMVAVAPVRQWPHSQARTLHWSQLVRFHV